jgi:PAS domain S-box-containing protein
LHRNMTGNDKDDAGIRLLLVEDDAESRQALSIMLDRRGVAVNAAPNGDRALRIFAKERFDIVVADIRMPGMSGLDLLRHIRAEDEDYPVILFTAYDSLDSAIQAVRLGAQDYILKPLDSIEDLIGPMKKAVRYHRLLLKNRALEQRLKESERRYRLSIENAPYGIAVADSAGRTTIFNTAIESITGYMKKDVPHMASWLTKICLEPENAALNNAVQRGVDFHGEELTVLRRDGEKRICEVVYNLLPSGIATVFLADITERKVAEGALRTSEEQLRALAARLQSIREEERTDISRRIHDELGHAMTGIKMDLAWFVKNLPDRLNAAEELTERAETMTHLLDRTISTTRKIATELRPGLLDHLGLCAAVEWQAEQFESRTGTAVHLNMSAQPLCLSEEQTTALFRIFQETLTNIARHSEATDVVVKLGAQDGQLVLEVLDNGIGITEDQIHDPRSLGLLGMCERARLLGGTFAIQGEKGTSVIVQVPVAGQ